MNFVKPSNKSAVEIQFFFTEHFFFTPIARVTVWKYIELELLEATKTQTTIDND